MARRFTLTRDVVEKEFNPNMILVTWASTVLSFVTALQWQEFIVNAVNDAEKGIRNPLPASVSALISSIIFSGLAIGGMYGLYIAAQSIIDNEDSSENV